VLVELDGKPMFTVVLGDTRPAEGETPEGLANSASRILQTAWSEAREKSDSAAALRGVARVSVAGVLLTLILVVIAWVSRRLRAGLARGLTARLNALPDARLGSRMAALLPGIVSRAILLSAWLLALLSLFLFLAYALAQFVVTRPAGEGLTRSLSDLVVGVFTAATEAIPGMFIAVLIFLTTWVATQISKEVFEHVGARGPDAGLLDAHTAPATRRIVNASLWLFAVAMAYPYLPGAHTEAFKGLSVILGLMVSIGASGLVGQIASGLILVYTRALRVGEYVRVQDCEGTVCELGLFVTRLRTGLGEEASLPNNLVLANVTRNFSRASPGSSFLLDINVTIGYDTPWRQVHALLLEAALTIPEVLREPSPFVVQTALSDFYVAYRLVVCVDAARPAVRARVASELHAAIQDAFNRYGVQIMSPHYVEDPSQAKVVQKSGWYAPPAIER